MTLSQDPETTLLKSSLKFSSALTLVPWASPSFPNMWIHLGRDVYKTQSHVFGCLPPWHWEGVVLSNGLSPTPSPSLFPSPPLPWREPMFPPPSSSTASLSLCVCIFLKRDFLTLSTLVCKFYSSHPGVSCPLDLKFCCG